MLQEKLKPGRGASAPLLFLIIMVMYKESVFSIKAPGQQCAYDI